MRRTDIDFLKGFAIIAVILYHMYILKSGYLGVDLFFVISGCLIVPKLVLVFSEKKLSFSYLNFIKKRFFRLWPLIIIASCVCFAIGYIGGMLPDDFENLSENIIAANLLSTNILSSITIKNYWAVRTSYQPLMHLWYVGILFEYYLLLPLLLYFVRFLANKFSCDIKKTIIFSLSILSLVSFAIYLIPNIPEMSKFYFLPSRFFELTLGGLLLSMEYTWLSNINFKKLYYILIGSLFIIICISIATIDWNHIGIEEIPIGAKVTIAPSNVFLLSRQWCLILTVVLSSFVVVLGKQYGAVLKNNILCHLGMMSYSLFIWHQIMLAFYRYYFTDQISWQFVIVFFVILYLVSFLSYYYVENKFKSRRPRIAILVLSSLVIVSSLFTYSKAGVVRDVPELNLYKATAVRRGNNIYTDKIYRLSKPFENNGKINVLLKGNSFARDFGSILLESNYHDKINFYLIRDWNQISDEMLKLSDYAFIFSNKNDVPNYLWHFIDSSRVYGIGTKTFGDSNGVIYKNRKSPNYYKQTIVPRAEYINLNSEWAKSWGDNYINIMQMSMDDEGCVRIFTPDSMYISQDCKHLTQAGAKHFGKMIDLDKIFSLGKKTMLHEMK